jgi:hypothetical protein
MAHSGALKGHTMVWWLYLQRLGNPLFSRLNGESNVAKHEATALEASEVMTTSRIINVEKHHAGVQLAGIAD